jgi:tetratricopeptide (TPR) repeat protein
MDTRTLLRERLRRSRDWTQTIDELENELKTQGTKPEQSERLFELAALVEDVIPERDRALGLYQLAWKLHPENLKALSRAREVYGEIGRYEMVAKLGEMELRSPLAAQNLAQIVGEALLDNGQKDKALPVLQRALGNDPSSIRVKDAIAALTYDKEFWSDEVDRLSDDADRFDDAQCVRMLLRAARIVKIEAPEDPRLEELLKRIFAKDIDEPSANFMYETALAAQNRWDEIEKHHMRRAEARCGPRKARRSSAHVRARVAAAFQGQGSRREVLQRGDHRECIQRHLADALGRGCVHAAAPGAWRQGRVGPAARPRRRRDRSPCTG